MKIFTLSEAVSPDFEPGPDHELAGIRVFRHRAFIRHGGIWWRVYLQRITCVIGSVLPTIALGCNIIVTASCSVQFARHDYVPWRGLLPMLAASVPMVFIGSLFPVQKWMFTLLLGVALLVSGILLITQDLRRGPIAKRPMRSINALVRAGIGGGIGLFAGIVGIGGGIFLSPILHLFNWNAARIIAGACSVFIMTNSVASLGGQLLKLQHVEMLGPVANHVWLFPTVLAGGLIGNKVNRQYLSPIWIRRVTGMLIVYVAARLLVLTPGVIADG